MQNSGKKENLSLREKFTKRFITKTDVPVIVYVSVVAGMIVCWMMRVYNEDIALNFMAELFGAAFTLFIIDVLLVRSKNKRWKIVQDDVDYLIARSINRLRDGLSIRAFNFVPEVGNTAESSDQVREQRNQFLIELEAMNITQLAERLHETELFSPASYEYFNERADDIWGILNMKYSEYLAPVLVSQLISLHIHLKDMCGHIRQYRKTERFTQDREYYRNEGIRGITQSLKQVLVLVNVLKAEGYSETARITEAG